MKKTRSVKSRAKTVGRRRAQTSTRAKRVPALFTHVRAPSTAGASDMDVDFASAIGAVNPVPRLRRFLRQYEPVNGEYQDAFHYNHVRAAQYELMRLEYIRGNVRAGDKLLAQLQDVESTVL
jgi:hypothetical protein